MISIRHLMLLEYKNENITEIVPLYIGREIEALRHKSLISNRSWHADCLT
jgi:hypothetical protein